jgi:hypothetical protein
MLTIRCKNCNTQLSSHPTRTKCCGCDNLTSIRGETITGLDLTLVELIANIPKKDKSPVFSKEDLAYHEARKNRKIRKLEFEIK